MESDSLAACTPYKLSRGNRPQYAVVSEDGTVVTVGHAYGRIRKN